MGRYFYGILLLSVLLWASCSATREANEKRKHVTQETESMKREGFGISMRVNRPIYSRGKSISMTLVVFNRTGHEVTFHFRSAQRYDFTIEDEEGKEVWRWSDGRMFAAVLGKEALGPDNEEIIYRAEYKGKLEPGNYKITGILVAKPIPMSANIAVSISNPFRNLRE